MLTNTSKPDNYGRDHSISSLLQRWGDGDRRALEQLFPILYAELRRLSARQIFSRSNGGELQPEAIIAEAFLRLVDHDVASKDREHFFSLGTHMMRQIEDDLVF